MSSLAIYDTTAGPIHSIERDERESEEKRKRGLDSCPHTLFSHPDTLVG